MRSDHDTKSDVRASAIGGGAPKAKVKRGDEHTVSPRYNGSAKTGHFCADTALTKKYRGKHLPNRTWATACSSDSRIELTKSAPTTGNGRGKTKQQRQALTAPERHRIRKKRLWKPLSSWGNLRMQRYTSLKRKNHISRSPDESEQPAVWRN